MTEHKKLEKTLRSENTGRKGVEGKEELQYQFKVGDCVVTARSYGLEGHRRFLYGTVKKLDEGMRISLKPFGIQRVPAYRVEVVNGYNADEKKHNAREDMYFKEDILQASTLCSANPINTRENFDYKFKIGECVESTISGGQERVFGKVAGYSSLISNHGDGPAVPAYVIAISNPDVRTSHLESYEAPNTFPESFLSKSDICKDFNPKSYRESHPFRFRMGQCLRTKRPFKSDGTMGLGRVTDLFREPGGVRGVIRRVYTIALENEENLENGRIAYEIKLAEGQFEESDTCSVPKKVSRN
jgi:hypothetical protein